MKVRFIGKGSEVEVSGIGLFKQGEVRELSDDVGGGLIAGNSNFIKVEEKPKEKERVKFAPYVLGFSDIKRIKKEGE